MTIQAIEKRAADAADPECKKCDGIGRQGYFRPADGGPRQVLICRCAVHAFPHLNRKEPKLSDMIKTHSGKGLENCQCDANGDNSTPAGLNVSEYPKQEKTL